MRKKHRLDGSRTQLDPGCYVPRLEWNLSPKYVPGLGLNLTRANKYVFCYNVFFFTEWSINGKSNGNYYEIEAIIIVILTFFSCSDTFKIRHVVSHIVHKIHCRCENYFGKYS